MRLLHAAFLFQNLTVGIGRGYRMDYSSPQSFGRHLRAVLGVTAGEFRRAFRSTWRWRRYIDLLITPYREALRALHPFNGVVGPRPERRSVSRAG